MNIDNESDNQYSTFTKEPVDASVHYFPTSFKSEDLLYPSIDQSPKKSWFNNLFGSKFHTICIQLTKPLHYNLIDMQNACTVIIFILNLLLEVKD